MNAAAGLVIGGVVTRKGKMVLPLSPLGLGTLLGNM